MTALLFPHVARGRFLPTSSQAFDIFFRPETFALMDAEYISKFVDHLKVQGVLFESGLSDDEVDHVERQFSLKFPPDLRQILQYALPVSKSFPNWRNGDEYVLAEQIRWAADGICFDIVHNNFWLDDWGAKPDDFDAACRVAWRELEKVPALVPICSHRFIPSEPFFEGNPVFSVYQTDIIYYGVDLATYFAAEFRMPLPSWAATEPRYIRFWGDLVS
jgi:hypothetical protein